MNATELKKVLNVATKLLGKRRAILILNTCVLRDDTLYATDLETSLIVKLPGLQCDTPVCVDPKTLNKLLPRGKVPVSITTGPELCVVNGASLACPLPVDEYPSIPDTALMAPASDTVTLPGKSDCQWVLKAAYTDESRPQYQGAYVDLDHGKLVATDGHRLHACSAGTGKLDPDFVRAVVPTTAFTALFALANDQPATCQYYVDNIVQYAVLRTGPITVITRLTDEPFPDHAQVFPSGATRIAVPMQPLVDALTTCRPLHPHVVFTPCDGGFTVSLPDNDVGKFESTITLGRPLPYTFSVNTGYLLDILEGFAGETCAIDFPKDDAKAALWTNLDGTRQALLMPLRKLP